MSCKLCDRLIISTGVTWTGTALSIALPAGSYRDGERFCIVVAQAIPATATIDAPVVFTIGANTEEFSLVGCNCRPVTACRIHARTKYMVRVETTPTTAVFRLQRHVGCGSNNLPAISG